MVPTATRGAVPFSRKRLLDVFIYTQFAHQPNPSRQRQFDECLAHVGRKRPVLAWLFLVELSACAAHIINAGQFIAEFYDHYCRSHRLSPAILPSVSDGNPRLGKLLKQKELKKRVFEEKVEAVAHSMWTAAGKLPGGPSQFLAQAREKLRAAMGEEEGEETG